MRKKKKYQWLIGESLPDLDEHSQTKHALIFDYIQRYVEVYMSNTVIDSLPITIVDGFAGGGKYNNILSNEVTDGSPFVILNAIHDIEKRINVGRNKTRAINAEYFFIERIKEHIDFLDNELNKSCYKSLIDKSIYLIQDMFEKAAPRVIDRIKNRNRSQRSLFILDQYAYKDVPFNTVKYILDYLQGSEVILTFNFNALQNYISDRPSNRAALSNIGLDPYIDWHRLAEFKEAGMWKTAIQEQLANAIHKASGARHITLFFISPKNGLTYWLVHLSKVYRARDVMMSLHWKHSNSSFTHHLPEGLFSLGYSGIETPGQASFDFVTDFDFGEQAELQCIQQLAIDLPKFIYRLDDPIPYSQLLDRIGSYTPASEQQIRKALDKVVKDGEIRIRNHLGSCRRSANQTKSGDLVSYCQKPLIFLPNK